MPTPDPRTLLILGYEGHTPPDALLTDLRTHRAGGVILFSRNIDSSAPATQTAAALQTLHAAAPPDSPPLILSIDQEGGRVQRLKDPPYTRWPPMARLGVRDDLQATEAVGHALGSELARTGFNVDFAPVLDVDTNPRNPVIGDRAFGHDPNTVTRHALAFWRGLERAGIRGCGKHFPGHGDTLQDSHLELPRLDAPWERLERVELAPFAAAARAGIPLLMTAHVVFSAIDPDRPATLSPAWLQGILRQHLGYTGVIIADDLDMQAVADHYPVDVFIREALRAGVDLFLACRNPERQQAAAAALDEAARDPMLAPRVADALARVHAFRHTLRPPAPGSPTLLPNPDHLALAASFSPEPRP